MEVSWLRVLLDNISAYLRLSSKHGLCSNPAHKYYTRGEEIGRLLKSVLENLINSDAASTDLLNNVFEELAKYFDELRQQFQSWQPLFSRIIYVLRIESLASKLRESSLELFQLLKHCEQHLLGDLISLSFEECIELVKLAGREDFSDTIDQALIDILEGVGPTPEVVVKIAECIGLRSNQEIEIESVVLSNLKENNTEAEFIDKLISLVTQMHDHLTNVNQYPVSVPSCGLTVERHIIPATIREFGSSSSIEAEANKLVEDLNCPSLDTLREATARIRILTKDSTENRSVFAKFGAINSLVNLITTTDESVQAGAVACLMNLSIKVSNKSVIGESGAIEPLIHVLKTGSQEAKENAGAALSSLSWIEENKVKIVEAGAIEPLVDLLGNGSLLGKKDAATALYNLSLHEENRVKLIKAGAVRSLVGLKDPAGGMVEKAVGVLANLAKTTEGQTAIGEEGGIPLLVEVVELGSARGKQKAASALLRICKHSPKLCYSIIREGAIPPLVALTKSGTANAKDKAQTLLKYFKAQKQSNQSKS